MRGGVKNFMPPKAKFGREEIVNVALSIVEKDGMEALTARTLGQRLGSSARPIFTVFKNMDEVACETIKQANVIFEKYIEEGLKENPPFKGVGKAYIRFASEKPKLFQLLFMKEKGVETKVERLLNNAEEYGKVVYSITSVYPVTNMQAANLYKHLWIYAHGIAVLIATKVCAFSDEEISDMLTVVFVSLLKEYLNKK